MYRIEKRPHINIYTIQLEISSCISMSSTVSFELKHKQKLIGLAVVSNFYMYYMFKPTESITLSFLLQTTTFCLYFYFHFTHQLSVCTHFPAPPQPCMPPRSSGGASFWVVYTPWCQSSGSQRPQGRGGPRCI